MKTIYFLIKCCCCRKRGEIFLLGEGMKTRFGCARPWKNGGSPLAGENPENECTSADDFLTFSFQVSDFPASNRLRRFSGGENISSVLTLRTCAFASRLNRKVSYDINRSVMIKFPDSRSQNDPFRVEFVNRKPKCFNE